jgi:hypothetical protein
MLLVLDGIINLVLGILLMLYPLGMASFLGLPQTRYDFYPTILGGVLFGIGLALLIERYGNFRQFHGLGLEGAIAINFCGAGVLMLWLLFGKLSIPVRGLVLLWAVTIVVFAIGLAEILLRVK